jgi:hypothetical protein
MHPNFQSERGGIMSENRSSAQWFVFWILWVMATATGYVVDRVLFRGSGAAETLVSVFKSWLLINESQLSTYEVVTSGVLGLIDGTILGFFQWAALRRHISKAAAWIPLTAAGSALGAALFYSLYDLFSSLVLSESIDSLLWLGLVDSLCLGLTLGITQWLILRRWVEDALFWVLTMLVVLPAAWLVRWFVNPLVAFFVVGAVSGLILVPLVAISAPVPGPEEAVEEPTPGS